MTLTNQLTALEGSGLIRLAQLEPELEYLFRHALIQDAAYESLLKQDRRWLHRAVGEMLERLYSDRSASRDLAPVIGRHYELAGDSPLALKYYLLAGQAALADYANSEAELHFRAGLGLAVAPLEKARSLFGLGQALASLGRSGEAIELYKQSAQYYRQAGDPENLARAMAAGIRANWDIGQVRLGVLLAEEGLASIDTADESPGLAELLRVTAAAHFFNGQPESAGLYLSRSMAIAHRIGAVELEARGLTLAGILPGQTLAERQAKLNQAVVMAESIGNLEVAGVAYNNLADLLEKSGAFRESRAYYQKSLQLAQRRKLVAHESFGWLQVAISSYWLGDRATMASCLTAMQSLAQVTGDQRDLMAFAGSLLKRLIGETAQSAAELQAQVDRARAHGEIEAVAQGGWILVEALLELDKPAEALPILHETLEIAETGAGIGSRILRCLLLAAYLGLGNIEEARSLLDQAQPLSDVTPNNLDLSYFRLAEARLAAAEQRWSEAFLAYDECARLEARMERRWYHAQTLREWAKALQRRGQPNDRQRAAELLLEGVAEFEALDLPNYAARSRLELAHTI